MIKKLKPTIALIDSGIGGISVLRALINKFHYGNYIYYCDNLYMPYGNKKNKFLKSRLLKIIKELKEKYLVDLIIVACNTASSVLINENLENVICMDFNSNYTYLTTPLTKANLTADAIADKTLAKYIENNIDNEKKLNTIIKNHVKKYGLNKLNNLVLGCTHYELVYELFVKYCPNTKVLKNSDFLVERINYSPQSEDLDIVFLQSLNSLENENKLKRLLWR